MAAPINKLLIRPDCVRRVIFFDNRLGFLTPTRPGLVNSIRNFNSNRNSITRIGRTTYARVYPTILVQPDGSTIRIRYNVPQKIIKLPIDVTKLSEDARRSHAERHKTKQKVVIEEELNDEFNVDQYINYFKKPK